MNQPTVHPLPFPPMVAKVILPDVVQLIELKQFDELKFVLIDLFPQDIAELIEGLENGNKGILLRLLPKNLAIEVFEHLAHSEQENLLLSFSNSGIKEILRPCLPMIAPICLKNCRRKS